MNDKCDKLAVAKIKEMKEHLYKHYVTGLKIL